MESHSYDILIYSVQGEEAYFKAVAAKHRYVTVSVLHRMSQTRESKLKVSNDHMRSKSALANRWRPPSLSPEAKFHAQLREKTKSTEPIARIIDPAIDTRKRSLPLRNLQELPQPGLERNPSSPDISLALTEVKFELKKKDKQIEHLQKNLHRLSLKSGASPEPGTSAQKHLTLAFLPQGQIISCSCPICKLLSGSPVWEML